ncbi:MAG: 2-hydroxychromene-2-carboxylate isomerase [Pseudomonadota bacterium]
MSTSAMPEAEFHFDFGSPNAYLSHLAIPQIEAQTGIAFRYVPVLLGGVFKATNNASPMVTENGIMNKREYRQAETARFLRDWDVSPTTPNPHFPVNTLQIMRGAVYAEGAGIFTPYVDAVFRHMWHEARKMDDADVIHEALSESGLPADDIMAGMGDAQVKQKLVDYTGASVSRGTFGSPTFFVGDEIFFGKNTLKEVQAEIELARG